MKITANASIKNRFTFEVKDTKTGKVDIYKAENIVLNQCFTRLVNFSSYFSHIHFGTGTGTLSPARTSLFNFLGQKTAQTVLTERALPTSRWQRQVVIAPEEYVGEEFTEVGIAYGTTSTNLCTHALIEDSEGNPISLVKTDTMVITLYADVFLELGQLTGMYSGQFRWVQPLANNQLLSYLLGTTYPTQYFRVSRAGGFADEGFHEGCAPGSHGQSSSITTANWIKDAANKKTTTPVRRLGISTGNGAIRGFGLGSSDLSGTFRGQLPIAGVFTGRNVEGEQVGVGDGVETAFSPAWEFADITAVYINDVVVDSMDYDLEATKKETELFALRAVEQLSGGAVDAWRLTDRMIGGSDDRVLMTDRSFGIDVGFVAPAGTFRVYNDLHSGAGEYTLYGSNNSDFSDPQLLLSFTTENLMGWFSETISPAAEYRYFVIEGGPNSTSCREIELLTANDQIVFNTPPADGEIITADYSVDYVPKDSDHVLDLQVAIQYGEG